MVLVLAVVAVLITPPLPIADHIVVAATRAAAAIQSLIYIYNIYNIHRLG